MSHALVPRWVNVVLEGGGLELERALAGYRTLRRLLEGAWVAKAPEVVDACDELEAREEAVEEAAGRARRRLRQDENARVVRALLDAVETERAGLIASLDAVLPPAKRLGGLIARVAELERLARDEAHFQLAWRRLERERVWLTATAAAWVTVPAASWWWASDGGTIPTLIDLSRLFDGKPAWFAAATSLLALVFGYARATSWSWLGVRVFPAAIPFFAGVGMLGGLVLAQAPMSVALGFSLLGGFVTASVQLLWSLWKPGRVQLPPPVSVQHVEP